MVILPTRRFSNRNTRGLLYLEQVVCDMRLLNASFRFARTEDGYAKRSDSEGSVYGYVRPTRASRDYLSR